MQARARVLWVRGSLLHTICLLLALLLSLKLCSSRLDILSDGNLEFLVRLGHLATRVVAQDTREPLGAALLSTSGTSPIPRRS